MRNRPVVQMLVIGIVGLAILLPIALWVVPWFPAKASRQAGNVHTLYDVLLIACIPVFVLVETVVIFSVWKFRMRPGQETEDGPPIHGNTRLEVVWTIAPALLLIGLASYSFAVLRSNEATKRGEMTVQVTERQFAFEFTYPNLDGRTIVSDNLYLPNNRPVVFKLRSLDVVHSFFVPEFSQKLDAVPGITTTLRVTPTRVGNYPVECTELCGAGHAFMRSTAHVMTPSAFQAWARAQKSGAAPPIGAPPPSAAYAYGSATTSSGSSSTKTSSASSSTAAAAPGASTAAGKALFASSGCTSCHTLAAAGATGTIGPDLDTRLKSDCALPASQKVRGAGLSKCIHTAIVDPYAFIPSGYQKGIMPATFGKTLSPSQIQSLVTFLEGSVK